MDLDLKAPDHTTLSRRNKLVKVPQPTTTHNGPIHLIVDSTGLKIFGVGEWNAHKHGRSTSRRDWRKLHIGVDEEGFIVASKLTESNVGDPTVVPDLCAQVTNPISRFTGDGAYDTRDIYDTLGRIGVPDIKIVIPPRCSAVPSEPEDGPWGQRNDAIQRIATIGREEWERESGYRKQSRAENTFYRYKQILGGTLRARDIEAQKRESNIGCNVLNRMADLGMPESYQVVA